MNNDQITQIEEFANYILSNDGATVKKLVGPLDHINVNNKEVISECFFNIASYGRDNKKVGILWRERNNEDVLNAGFRVAQEFYDSLHVDQRKAETVELLKRDVNELKELYKNGFKIIS